ncbi:helicase-exonuclease AddAB subunit AddA [Marinicrinis sediminis]|uniref:ATP-dependent helicase/nuclease subunit A n=1 Tax=Marinicrinis sediminis TaxID=1652465 RepID=A0ABW5RBM3_9BACL
METGNRLTRPENSIWTDDQWRAIATRGHDLLVAAAAGSGKTAVLVERIIRTITNPDDPVDVDRLLVATFTKAAADEMRQRIREALESRLDEEKAGLPEYEHIRRQIALIHRAPITTLHSFCLDVVRKHIQQLQLDPKFRIANETEIELIRREVMEELFEAKYEEFAEDLQAPFWAFVDRYSSERSDEGLYFLVEQIYDFARSHPDPTGWVTETARAFGSAGAADGEQWLNSLRLDMRLQLEQATDGLKSALLLCQKPAGPLPYKEQLEQELQDLQRLMNLADPNKGEDWDTLHAAFQQNVFARLQAIRGDEYDKTLQEKAKKLRDQAKETMAKLKEQLFERTREQYMHEMEQLAPLMEVLSGLVLSFADRFQEAKRERNIVDFNDLEHFALAILREEETAGKDVLPSSVALTYQSHFVEILIDEYQDTNRVQETILQLIAKPAPGNRFMVGDVKQSIYRFRLAEPSLFLAKYRSYRSAAQEPSDLPSGSVTEGEKIDLSRNFRSRHEVLDAVNYVFRQLMNEGIAEIAYDKQAELVPGADYPLDEEGTFDTEWLLLERDGAAEEADDSIEPDEDGNEAASNSLGLAQEAQKPEAGEMETAQMEAKLMAMQIRRLVGTDGEPFMVYDRKLKGKRPATYRDIVILMRATQSWAPLLMEEFRQASIPCYADLNAGYFSAGEVEFMLSLLKVIDNPYQDIPIAAVLRSPVYELNAEELAQLRIHVPSGQMFDAVVASARDDAPLSPELKGKLGRFLADLERWRDASKTQTVSQLVTDIYRRTGYYDMVGGFPGGTQRQANLRALFDRAKQYESTSFRGLFRFLRFIEKMLDSGGDLGTARALGEQEDVVRIMSIHKSKGLEFPVVFVAGLGKKFNQQDLNGHFILHKELGFGPKFVDLAHRVSYPSLPNLAIKRKLRWEMLAEEMRVLYVALTRAKEKLYLVGTVRQLDRHIEKWATARQLETLPLEQGRLARAQTYLDWLGPALMRHPAGEGLLNRLASSEGTHSSGFQQGACREATDDRSSWRVHLLDAQQFLQAAAALEDRTQTIMDSLKSASPLPHMSGGLQAEVGERLGWTDPNRRAAELFAKTSVTEMKRMAELHHEPHDSAVELDWDEDRGSFTPKTQTGRLLRRPRFKEEAGMTAVERGTLYHAVMQHIPLQGTVDEQVVQETLAMMLHKRLIHRSQHDAVELNEITGFFRHEVGRRLMESKQVYRELPFSYLLKSGEVYDIEEAHMRAEPVLIQGVVDCLFEDGDGGWVLIDYKTDTLARTSPEQLQERYRIQIQLYRKALQDIIREPIHQAYLYLFDSGEVIEMP